LTIKAQLKDRQLEKPCKAFHTFERSSTGAMQTVLKSRKTEIPFKAGNILQL
jgi:hypothetical protein